MSANGILVKYTTDEDVIHSLKIDTNDLMTWIADGNLDISVRDAIAKYIMARFNEESVTINDVGTEECRSDWE